MLTMSTPDSRMGECPSRAAAGSAAKPAGRYHHGDLPRAMVQEAVRAIQKQGVDALTLRVVGERLGVSRTALYRHFADKQALLGAVAAEGFRMLRQATAEALTRLDTVTRDSGPWAWPMCGLRVAHPAHYRIMSAASSRRVRDRPVSPIPTPTRFRCWWTPSSNSSAPGSSGPTTRCSWRNLHLVGGARHRDAGARRPCAAKHGYRCAHPLCERALRTGIASPPTRP